MKRGDDYPRGVYRELDVGESITSLTSSGEQCAVKLQRAGDKSVTMRVGDREIDLPLGHFADRTLGNPPGDVVNMVAISGLRIGADVTRHFMSRSNYAISMVNLKHDARIFVGPAEYPFFPPGSHVFPVRDYEWNFGKNWLKSVVYGWHLGVDLDAEVGHPLVAVTDGTVLAIRHFDTARDIEDFWGNGLALLGNDGLVYIYMHWDRLAGGVAEGSRVEAGDDIGVMGRSGFDSRKNIATHLHFEVLVIRHPGRFRFAFALEPEVLPTPNRILSADTDGHVVNPYPYLVEWYSWSSKAATKVRLAHGRS